MMPTTSPNQITIEICLACKSVKYGTIYELTQPVGSCHKKKPQHQLDLLSLFFHFISWIIFRVQLSQCSVSVCEMTNPNWLADWHISEERVLLVYSEQNISLQKKAARGLH